MHASRAHTREANNKPDEFSFEFLCFVSFVWIYSNKKKKLFIRPKKSKTRKTLEIVWDHWINLEQSLNKLAISCENEAKKGNKILLLDKSRRQNNFSCGEQKSFSHFLKANILIAVIFETTKENYVSNLLYWFFCRKCWEGKFTSNFPVFLISSFFLNIFVSYSVSSWVSCWFLLCDCLLLPAARSSSVTLVTLLLIIKHLPALWSELGTSRYDECMTLLF